MFEDFEKLSKIENVVKPRAKSIMEETEGIARIIDMMESNMWTGAVSESSSPAHSAFNNTINVLQVMLARNKHNKVNSSEDEV